MNRKRLTLFDPVYTPIVAPRVEPHPRRSVLSNRWHASRGRGYTSAQLRQKHMRYVKSLRQQAGVSFDETQQRIDRIIDALQAWWATQV